MGPSRHAARGYQKISIASCLIKILSLCCRYVRMVILALGFLVVQFRYAKERLKVASHGE